MNLSPQTANHSAKIIAVHENLLHIDIISSVEHKSRIVHAALSGAISYQQAHDLIKHFNYRSI